MDKWNDKIAVVTGSNSGCGLKIVEELAKNGMQVVGLDVMDDQILKLANTKIHPIICDITDDDSVRSAFEWIDKNLSGGVDVLVNCAGITNSSGIFSSISMAQLEKCMSVNCCGAIRCARHAFKSMQERNVHGIIININSVAGHRVIDMGNCQLGFYSPSKHALTAAIETMRCELNNMGNRNIRVTSISPGVIDTSLFKTSKLPEQILQQIESNMKKLKAQDIADAVVYVLSLPYRINISELMIRATGSSF
jgi:NADP+-dependent farnesol dehydrogenase